MKRTLRRMAIVFAAALMVMMMAVPSFAATFPISTTVYFYSQGGTVTQYGGSTVTFPAWNTGAIVTYQDQNTFTTNYITPFPAPSGVTNQYWDTQPTIMDAIYDTYYALNGYSNSGINIGWDTVNVPNGAYVDEINNISEIPEIIQSHKWKGYSWHIFLNGISSTWNSSTRTGRIPYYASNMPLENGDVVYVRFLESTVTW